MKKLELELACWRPRKTINSEEQINIYDIMVLSTLKLAVEITAAAPNNPNQTMPATSVAGLMVGSIIADKGVRLELERECLYRQLHEEDD